MLRVVLKLHHPQISIRTQHQLALRSTAHPANRLHRHNRQGPFPFLSRVAHPYARVSASCFGLAPEARPLHAMVSARTACPIAMAITRSSCDPAAAAARPRSSATKVLHSASSRRLINLSGVSLSSTPMRATISGFDAADVSQPASPCCLYTRL